jgi:hypothetical protein
MGEASQPTLRSDVENVVKKIEGVEKVKNEIVVLPLSSNDDRLAIRGVGIELGVSTGFNLIPGVRS